jgi:hypothetical protein
MPTLLRLAGEPAPSRDAIEKLNKSIQEGLMAAANADYRLDKLTGTRHKSLDETIGAEEPDPIHESEEGRATADPEFAGDSKAHEDLPIKHKATSRDDIKR